MILRSYLKLVKSLSPILAVLISIPTMSLALVDVSRLKESSFYGLYIDDLKVGYSEIREVEKIVEGDKIFAVTSNLYFEERVDEDILVSETSYSYEFDSISREIITYTEISETTSYQTKEDLLINEHTEITSDILTARYLGNATYRLNKGDKTDQENKIITLPALTLDDFYADVDLVQNFDKSKASRDVAVSEIDFHELSVTAAKVTVTDRLEYTSNGHSFIHYEVMTEDDDGKYFGTYDEDGNLLELDLSGLRLKLEPEVLAKSFSEDRHIAALFSVPIDKVLPSDTNLSVIMLKVFGEDLRESFVENKRQKLLQKTDDFSLLQLSYGDVGQVNSISDDWSEYLADTIKFNWKNEALARINPSDQLSDLSDQDKVMALLEFSQNYLEYKFTLEASLDQIIEQQVGDCTEYAQLFVSLARLNGIPAREVSGLVYNYDDDKPEFQAHAWAEVWLNGRWKEVDPGWNEFNIDASHITLSSDFLLLGSRLELVGFR